MDGCFPQIISSLTWAMLSMNLFFLLLVPSCCFRLVYLDATCGQEIISFIIPSAALQKLTYKRSEIHCLDMCVHWHFLSNVFRSTNILRPFMYNIFFDGLYLLLQYFPNTTVKDLLKTSFIVGLVIILMYLLSLWMILLSTVCWQ